MPLRRDQAQPAKVVDRLSRPLRDLRVSVTDRCNFRCTYCMPREVFGPGFQFLEREELLSFEEITRVMRIFARCGVRKVRLTGGEPLVRRDVERLVAMLAGVEGIDDLAMTTNGWRLDDVVPAAEIVRRIDAELPLEPVDPNYEGEVATRYRYRDGGGEIGVIASVTQPFCQGCTRARLSAVGELFTCLFAVAGRDLRALLRTGAGDEELHRAIWDTWSRRTDRYSEERSSGTAGTRKVEMSYIGG